MDNRIFLQRYRLSRGRNGQPVELHRTPTSVTYRAQEIETGREVALERVTADISNPGLRELLESEATTARQIRHINIPRLYDFGFDQDELIYVTEYFDGHTAAASLAAQGPLHPAAVFQIALQVVAAMDAMAFHSIHHHALNPDNLVFVADAPSVGDSHPIKVLHWLGVAPLFTETNDPRLDNAARFTSPEQLYTGKVDVRSEIYSLGCTLWFLLTGVPPNINPQTGEVAVEDLHGVPKIVRHLLKRMLRPEPDERPQDLVALSAFLQTCLARAERQDKPRRSLVGPPDTGWAFRPKTFALAAAVIALATLAVFAVPRYLVASRTAESGRAAGSIGRPTQRGLAKNDVSNAETNPTNVSGPIVEVPREGEASIMNNAPSLVNEPAPPEEGPDDITSSSSVVANDQLPPPPPESTPTRRQSELAPIVIAKNDSNPLTENPEAIEASLGWSGQTSDSPDQSGPAGEIMPPEEVSDDEPFVAEADPSTAPEFSLVQEEIPVPAATPVTRTRARHAQHFKSGSTAKKRSVSKTKPKVVARKAGSQRHSRKQLASSVSVKRAKAIPDLHFGSARAELVGTTNDGHWILSVGGDGQRVVVPPPPGFKR